MRQRIIEQFHEIELENITHTDDYLDEIASQNSLEDLIETVAMWVRICEGDKYKAAMYILEILDKAK